ncbi:MAG TPA: enoyl-CoA hydratase-related protein [Chroococcales cyanobacterium]
MSIMVNQTTDSVLLVETDGPLAWFKLNRPKVLNCLNRDLLKALLAACEEVRERRDIRVVAIIGSGVKTFCAGADLTERKSMTALEAIDYLGLIQRTMLAIEALPQVVIGAINGSAFGGGTELALSCDLRVMAENASLRLTEVTLGIIPGAGGTQRLPRLIGKSKAKEMILTAAPLSAAKGEALGLIHRVVPAAADGDWHKPLIDEVKAWSAEISTAAPLSLKQAKVAIDEGFDRDLEAGLALETRAYLELINTKDRMEGLTAFAEKRKPVYVGE